MAKKYATTGNLIKSLVIDAIGVATYAIPGIAEIADVIWAPISAVAIYSIYDNTLMSVVGAVEEIAPGTDIVPTATALWVYHKFKEKR